MTFLHFDENIDPACLARLVSRGFLGIACEAVRVSGRAPILEPMSRLTGHLFAQRAIELCTRHSGRLAPGLDPALGQVGALLIGTGEIGLSVLQVWRALRLRLTVLANRDRDAVNAEANHRFGTRDRDYLPADEVTFLQMDVTDPARTQAALAAALPSVAIVVNAAVRRSSLPRDRLAHLITRPMLAALAPGSIVCDATACDRDLIETCVSSPISRQSRQSTGSSITAPTTSGPGAGYRKRPLRGSPPALRARSRRRGRGGRPSPRHAAPWGDRLRGRPTHRHAQRRAQEPPGLAHRFGAGGLVGGCGRAWHGPLPSPSGDSRSRRDEQGRPCRDGARPLGGRARHDRGSATDAGAGRCSRPDGCRLRGHSGPRQRHPSQRDGPARSSPRARQC